jgi:hypothetical protein
MLPDNLLKKFNSARKEVIAQQPIPGSKESAAYEEFAPQGRQ